MWCRSCAGGGGAAAAAAGGGGGGGGGACHFNAMTAANYIPAGDSPLIMSRSQSPFKTRRRQGALEISSRKKPDTAKSQLLAVQVQAVTEAWGAADAG